MHMNDIGYRHDAINCRGFVAYDDTASGKRRDPGRPIGSNEYPGEPLPSLGRFPPHDRNVSIGLVCNHLPAPHEAGQNRGFGAALREQHQAMAFFCLGSAPVCMIHGYAFTAARW
jgi:hypothetical protein